MASIEFPELYSVAKNKSIPLQKAKSLAQLHNIFHLSLSEEDFAQYTELQNLLSSLPVSTEADSWSYIWGASYSCSKAYKQMKGIAKLILVSSGYGNHAVSSNQGRAQDSRCGYSKLLKVAIFF